MKRRWGWCWSLLLVSPAWGAQDSLRCYPMLPGTPRPPVSAVVDVTGAPDFSAIGCRVVGQVRSVCVPVEVGGAPAEPFSVPTLTRGYTCWKVKCQDVPKRHEVVDRFGNGQEDFHSPKTLCVPAVLDECQGGTCGSYSGCHESGACSCFTVSKGQHFCAVPTPCANTTPCEFHLQDSASHGGWAEGSVCIIGSCCGPAVCVPATSLCAPGDPPPPSPPPGTSTTAGVQP